MNGPGAAGPGRSGAPAGLLEKLIARVRPEFRAEVLTFDPRDPVFGGPPCAVPGCERVARTRNMCWSHHQRWHYAGKPDLAAFTASASPEWYGHLPLLACEIPGCNFCPAGRGLCRMHHMQWSRAGCPDMGAWRASVKYSPPSPPPGTCLVPYCERWAMRTSEFCHTHHKGWRRAGGPAAGEFAAACADPGPGHERIDIRCLPRGLRLEVQYALQCRRDESQMALVPVRVQRFVRDLATVGVSSLLERTEEQWAGFEPRRVRAGGRQFILDARARVELLAFGGGWETEYPRSKWRLRNLGFQSDRVATIDFAPVAQPWLSAMAKRWCRWQLSAGLSASHAGSGIRAVRRFSAFLARHGAGDAGPASVTRPLLERYLADLSSSGLGPATRLEHISALNGLFRDARRHGWDDGALPAGAVFYPEDFPKKGQRLPRAVAEHIMTQVEAPANLDRWASSPYRLITLILIRCGLRITDACKIPSDCVVTDSGAPYLRYYNHKMRREALVPIDEEITGQIAAQRQRAAERWPGGTPVLFPRPNANLRGTRPTGAGTYREALYAWLETCDIRDEHGKPVHLTPHQWRHTVGTRLINRDVPQHVVQKILDHDSPAMTAHYARLSDKTVREHWERARKVNAEGRPVQISPDGPLGDAAWAKHRLSRATQALPNGYCELPLVQTCPHANSCLTCPMFVTTAEFLPQHRHQQQATLQVISAAEAAGQARVAEMNRQVSGNLDKIIAALEADGPDEKEAAAGAS